MILSGFREVPQKWPDDDYDTIFKLDFDKGEAPRLEIWLFLRNDKLRIECSDMQLAWLRC